MPLPQAAQAKPAKAHVSPVKPITKGKAKKAKKQGAARLGFCSFFSIHRVACQHVVLLEASFAASSHCCQIVTCHSWNMLPTDIY